METLTSIPSDTPRPRGMTPYVTALRNRVGGGVSGDSVSGTGKDRVVRLRELAITTGEKWTTEQAGSEGRRDRRQRGQHRDTRRRTR